MDESEAIAKKLLKHMGFTDVSYEPDGNVPPDFLADGRVAVEVRRLNQNYDSGDGMQGLEEVAISLWDKIEKLVHSFGPAESESWYVRYRFGRPVMPWNELKPKLKSALTAFKNQPVKSNGLILSDGTFELNVIGTSKPHRTYFHMHGHLDHQACCFIDEDMLFNIEHCVKEKSQKIANVKSKYNEWWLVLTDHMGFGLDDVDEQELRAKFERPTDWDKIFIVRPGDPTRYLEL